MLGLLPHVRFSLLIGRLAWFESAYDEATYALWAFTDSGPRLPSRWLSEAGLQLLLVLTGSWDRALIAADAAFPALNAVLAWVLAGRLTRLRLLRLALALGLLFAQELFSFGCWTIWRVSELVDLTPSSPPTVFDLRFLRDGAPAWLQVLVPNYSGPFLSLFRTPEPQVSLALLFGALILAFDLSRPEADAAPAISRRTVAAAALNALLGLAYFFEATVIVLVQGLLGVLLLAGGSRRRGRLLVALAALGGVSTVLGALVSQSDSAARSWAFRSHLPVATPATLAACAGLAACAALLWRRRGDHPVHLPLAAACFGAVLLVTNQQVLTGRMISTRDWERYADYPLVFLGLALLALAGLRLTSARVRLLYAAAGAALAAASHGLVVAQDRVFEDEFRAANLKSAVMAHALRSVEARGAVIALLVLEEPALSPLLQSRLGRRVPVLADPAQIDTRQIDPVERPDGASGRRSLHARELFEYFVRMGRAPGSVGRQFQRETDEGSGLALSLLFDLRDFWDPITDARAARRDVIRAQLPGIHADYERYASGYDPCWARTALVLTRQAPGDRVSPLWRETLVLEATVGREEPLMNVYLLFQTLAAAPALEGDQAHVRCEP